MALGRITRKGGRLADVGGQVSGDTVGCCWKQSRLCSDNTLSGKWLPIDFIPATNALIEGLICYYFNPSDAESTACPGTAHITPVTSTPDCTTCLGGGSPPIPCVPPCNAGTPRFVYVTPALNLCPLNVCRESGGDQSDTITGAWSTVQCWQIAACHWQYSGESGVTHTTYGAASCGLSGGSDPQSRFTIDAEIIPDGLGNYVWRCTIIFSDGQGILNADVSAPIANCTNVATIAKTDGVACAFPQLVTVGGSVTLTPSL